MQIVVVDISPPLRATLLGRVQEACRKAGLQRIAVMEVDPLNLDTVNWRTAIGCFLGVGCGSMIKELLGKLQGSRGECPLAIVLDGDTYSNEAVAIHKILGRTVVCETDLTQMATFIVDCERHASGRPLGPKTRHIVGVTQLKGGVGATTITTSLGACLARSGRTVCLLDFDDVSPQVSEWAKVGSSKRSLTGELLRVGQVTTDRLRDLVGLIDGFNGRLGVIAQPALYSEGFHYRAQVLDGAPSSSEFVTSLLSVLSVEYEVVIVDLGRSWGVATFAALPWCDQVIFVMDDDGLSVRRSLDVLNRLHQESGDPEEFNFAKWSIVFNKVSGRRLAIRDVEGAVEEMEMFPRDTKIFPVGFSDAGRQWGGSGETFYDLAEGRVRKQLLDLSYHVVPQYAQQTAAGAERGLRAIVRRFTGGAGAERN